MDDRHFDMIARLLGSAPNRRFALRGLAGITLGSVLGAFGLDNADAKRKHHHGKKKGGGCGSGKKKCHGNCIKKSDCCNDSDCSGGQVCQGKTCTCPEGTKDCAGACIPSGNCCTSGDCGECESCQGGSCVSGCLPGQTCQGGTCACPSGQKECQGACIPNSNCCTSGDCQSGQACQGGQCVCNASSCAGCCSGTTCRGGGSSAACGQGGVACVACGQDQACLDGQCVDTCGGAGDACTAGDQCCTGVCSCDGGKLNNPESNTCHQNSFSQPLTSNVNGWYDWNNTADTWPGGTTTIQFAPNAEIAVSDAYQGQLTAMTLWGGYSATFPGNGYDTSIDIFLDPSTTANDQHVDYTSAINTLECAWRDEGVFHAGKNAVGSYCVSTGGGSGTVLDPCTQTDPLVDGVAAGWYTFRHEFRIVGGNLQITMRLLQGGTEVKSWVQVGTAAAAGGNRYGWFSVNQISDLQVRNSSRTPA